MASSGIDYYATLEVDPQATQAEIREAYKRAALKHHPDRVPTDSPERATRTKKFQQINDAYYTLSDPKRRRDYDSTRPFKTPGGSGGGAAPGAFPDDFADGAEGASSSHQKHGRRGFPWSAFGFGGEKASSEQEFSNEQFGSVFEEMMREEGMAEGEKAAPTGKFWSMVGGLSGGAMGFIVANFPGAIAGAVAGNRLGAVRDTRGKSVYDVFQELPQTDRMRLLTELATKVFAHAVSG